MSIPGREVYVVPFSHLDLFWLGSQEECLSRGNRIINEAIKIAKGDKNFHFLLEIVIFVKNFVESHPEKIKELKKLIKDGRIEVGPRWAGIYQNPQSGEDLVRNILYAKEFLREFLDTDVETANLGDLPGYTPQYPQILAKTGIHNIIVTRGCPKNIPLYFWQAPDGSKVLTWHSINGYSWARDRGLHRDKEKMQRKELEEEIKEMGKLTPAPILMHWGVDLILPTKNLSQNIKEWNQRSEIKLKLATPTHYFTEAKKVSEIPIISGEIPSVWPPIDMTKLNYSLLDIPATNILLSAEKFATISYLLGFLEYPTEEFKRAWQRLLQGMDHNGNGQGAIEGDERKLEYRKMAIFVGEEILRSSLRVVAENVKVEQGSQCNPIVVFNSLSWDRDGLANAHVTFHGDIEAFDIAKYRNVVLRDRVGKEIPFQYLDVREGVSRDVTISFYAKNVPSIGYNTFYLVPSHKTPNYGKSCQISEPGELEPGEIESKKWPLRKEVIVLENEYYLVRVNKLTGIIDITDKKIKQEIIQGMKLFAVEEKSANLWARTEFTGRTFENAINEVKIVGNGPISAKVSIKGKIRESVTRQEIILYKDIPRIDVVDIINWEAGQPLRIQQLFPLQIKNSQVNYGIPYGVNSFENVQLDGGPIRRDEIPENIWKCSREIQKWIDVSNEKYGVIIASNERAVEVEKLSLIKFNLIRGTQSPFCKIIKDGRFEYLWNPPKGEYIFRFGLRSHKGDWEKAKSYRDGWELVNPLICVSVNDPVSKKNLPPQKSFCNVSADNVLITVLKKGEKNGQPILRCYETEGIPKKIKINFFKEIKSIIETNLLEDGLKPFKGQINKNEIKTLSLHTK